MKHRTNRTLLSSLITLTTLVFSHAASSQTNFINVHGAEDFQTGNKFQCSSEMGSVLTAEILDIGDQDAYVHIKSRNQDKLYHNGAVIGRNTSEGFSFLMIENGESVGDLLVHPNTAKFGKGTGLYLNKRVTCKWLERPINIGDFVITSSIHATSGTQNPNSLKSNYISQGVPFAQVNGLKRAIENRSGVPLKDRREAHITVVSPIEMAILNKKLSTKAIFDLAQVDSIQDEPFQIACVGQGQILRDGKMLKTYFLVIQSEGIAARRTQIEEAFVNAGGTSKSFKAEDYYPHITIGFTDDDLHISDGIVKGTNSCAGGVKIVN